MSQEQRFTWNQRGWWKFPMVLPWITLGIGVASLYFGLSFHNYVVEMVGISLMTASVVTASLIGFAAFITMCLHYWRLRAQKK